MYRKDAVAKLQNVTNNINQKIMTLRSTWFYLPVLFAFAIGDDCYEYSNDYPSQLGPCDFPNGMMRLKKPNCGDSNIDSTMKPSLVSTLDSDVSRTVVSTTEAILICPEGWIFFNTTGDCYLFFLNTSSNWHQCEAYCKDTQENSYLVSIDNEPEQHFISYNLGDEIKVKNYTANFIWIGLKKTVGWEWNHQPATMNWTYWLPGHPEAADLDFYAGCGAILVNTTEWYNAKCLDSFYGCICEMPSLI
ncbi:snaclec rhodocetin subunit alpha-like [Apostichopus japonicus]|uniref:snaclec rhodocetin subunit alpha-like n=1 Tax=Stichopus japonicus TaxID=307972 RepID=UPI003AB43D6D